MLHHTCKKITLKMCITRYVKQVFLNPKKETLVGEIELFIKKNYYLAMHIKLTITILGDVYLFTCFFGIKLNNLKKKIWQYFKFMMFATWRLHFRPRHQFIFSIDELYLKCLIWKQKFLIIEPTKSHEDMGFYKKLLLSKNNQAQLLNWTSTIQKWQIGKH